MCAAACVPARNTTGRGFHCDVSSCLLLSRLYSGLQGWALAVVWLAAFEASKVTHCAVHFASQQSSHRMWVHLISTYAITGITLVVSSGEWCRVLAYCMFFASPPYSVCTAAKLCQASLEFPIPMHSYTAMLTDAPIPKSQPDYKPDRVLPCPLVVLQYQAATVPWPAKHPGCPSAANPTFATVIMCPYAAAVAVQP